jgi:hypothetical protein
MAYQRGMKPPKKKQFAASGIETDLSRIQQLSEERDDENWDFRSWLKQNAPDNIDGLVKALSQKYFALIDCRQCANCCRSLHAEFKESELLTIDRFFREAVYVGRQSESAVPDAGWKTLLHLRKQTGSLPVVSSPRTTAIYIPTDGRD